MSNRINVLRLSEQYAIDNRQAAVIIAAQPARYPGVMQEWARVILAQPAPSAAAAVKRGEQVPMFREEKIA